MANSGVAVAAIATIGLGPLIFAYIVQRESVFLLFASGTAWNFVEEWSGYLLVLIAYLGMAYTLRSGGHLKVNMAIEHLPPRLRAGWEAFLSLVSLCIIIYLVVMAGNWWVHHLIANKVHSIWQSRTLLYIPYTFLIVGMICFTLAILMHIVRKATEAVVGVDKMNDRGHS